MRDGKQASVSRLEAESRVCWDSRLDRASVKIDCMGAIHLCERRIAIVNQISALSNCVEYDGCRCNFANKFEISALNMHLILIYKYIVCCLFFGRIGKFAAKITDHCAKMAVELRDLIVWRTHL